MAGISVQLPNWHKREKISSLRYAARIALPFACRTSSKYTAFIVVLTL